MKRISAIAIILTIIIQMMSFSAFAAGDTIYVSPKGNDLNGDGSFENPYLTMAKAKSVVRDMSKNSGNINVIFMGGEYKLTNIAFTAEDSGSENGRVIYKSYDKNDKAIFTSAADVSPSLFNKVADYEILKKLPYNARANVVCLNLSTLGINASLISDYYPQLYVNNEAQFIARYPNSGYLTADKANGTESFVCYDDDDDLLERSKKWIGVTGAQIDGSVSVVYAWNTRNILSVDENGVITLDGTIRSPATRTGEEDYYVPAQYYITNLIEELDSPGEYYVDMKTNVLYYYPNDDFSTSKISIDGYDSEKVISLTNTKYVSFEDLSFERTGKRVIYGTNLDDVDIRGCSFINIQSGAGTNCYAIDVSGYNIDVDSNYAYMCKDNFIRFNGGALDGFVRGNINVTNNRIFACGFESGQHIIKSGQPSTEVSTNIGNNVSNNVISDCSGFAAICVPGNDVTVHNNEIYNFGREYNDAGAIYFGKSNLKYGNTVKYNYVHDLNEENEYAAFYSDDGYGGLTIKYNIVKDTYTPFFTGMGMNNDFSDNLFVNCSYGMSNGTRMTSNWDNQSADGQPGMLTSLTNEAKNTFGIWGSTASKPYKDDLLAKYQDMKNFETRKPYLAPWNTVVTGNVSIGSAPAINSFLNHAVGSVWDEEEKNVSGYNDALKNGFVDELMLYGPSDIKTINGKQEGNPQLTYSDAYFKDAKNQDYTPTQTLISAAANKYANTGIGNIDLTDLGIKDKSANVEFSVTPDTIKVYSPVVSDSGKTSILWERVKNASYYIVKISENKGMSNCISKEIFEQGSFCAADFELENGKTYYMTVSAVSLGKETSNTVNSDVIEFSTDDYSEENLSYALSFLKDRIDNVESGIFSCADNGVYSNVKDKYEYGVKILSSGNSPEKNSYSDEVYDVLISSDEYFEYSPAITKAELSLNSDVVTVSGFGLKENSLISVIVSTPGYTKETASIDKSTKSIRYMNFVSSDRDGHFSFEFPTAKLSEIEYEGEFTVYAVDSEGCEISKTYKYASVQTGDVKYYNADGEEITDFSAYEGKNVTVEIPVINRTKTDYTPAFIITQNSGGKIKNIYLNQNVKLASETSENIRCEIVYNESDTYEYMIWDSFGIMKPLTRKTIIEQ